MEVNYFTPGQRVEPGLPLAPYRSATPAGVLVAYLDAYTRPGDLIIDLFCHGPQLIREAVQAGRRALGLNVNRALLLAASLGLTTPEQREVEAAFTQLADARKGSETLQAHIQDLYRTTCVVCNASTVADVFVWERGLDVPVVKRYRCAACGDARAAPTNEQDRTRAQSFKRRGLDYWLLLDRAAPLQESEARESRQGGVSSSYRDRLAALLDLYTPRNLSALNDVLLKYDGFDWPPLVSRTLDGLLLDTFDRASSLRSPNEDDARPRSLQLPARYVEQNVWRLLEQALSSWRQTSTVPVPRASSLEELLNTDEAMGCLTPLSAGQARQGLPEKCTPLVVVDPPRPDTVLWHMSALWSGWLWGSPVGAALEPFVRRRRLDWDWFWPGMRGALQAITPLMDTDGRLVMLWSAGKPNTMAALSLAGAGAGYRPSGWGTRVPDQGRLVWHRSGSVEPPARETAASPQDLANKTVEAGVRVLHKRGEPTHWPTLHDALYAELAGDERLAQMARRPEETVESLAAVTESLEAALESAPLQKLTAAASLLSLDPEGQPLWWLADAQVETRPLNDRVELAVAALLRDSVAIAEEELDRRICAHFPEAQTPAAQLVRLCLSSYGDEHAPGHWRLRVEDGETARAQEVQTIVENLTGMGRELGFKPVDASGAGAPLLRWCDSDGRDRYVFHVRTDAVLSDVFLEAPVVEERTTPCLVLPGGRAALVGYKLRWDPRWRRQVAEQDWQLVKFRHVRYLVEQLAEGRLESDALGEMLGLDPIVEEDQKQMTLW